MMRKATFVQFYPMVAVALALVVGIVVVDAVAEEDPLGIDQEVVPFLTPAGAGIFLEDVLKDVADLQIILEILVPGNVAARLCRFTQMIDIFLLLK